MRPQAPAALLSLALLGACALEPPVVETLALGSPESSQLTFQAVDAGTGSALTDSEMTVRYLVRAPITLNASAVESVPAAEAYRIQHEVAEADLVVEVRLEADSYHRLDTVLSVPRGGSGGPFTIRMARRLDQVAQGAAAPTTRPAVSTTPPASQPTTQPAASGPAPIDRAPLDAGNRAFASGDWNAAVNAYERMSPPNDPSSAYASEYAAALTQRGQAHLNRGEMGGALEAFEDAVEFEGVGYRASLGLGQTQCMVGRTEEGRGTLAILGREVNRMPPADRPTVAALIEYQRGRCSEGEFDRATETLDRVRTGAAAIRELEAFVEQAGGISSPEPELQAAIDDAGRRIDDIRQKIRGGV